MLRVKRRPVVWDFVVKTRGGVVESRAVLVNRRSKCGPSGRRGDVSVWSRRSRTRMCKAVASQNWNGNEVRVFVTLTFASELKHDGRHELDLLHRRMLRRYGQVHGLWWREFQRRGTCHYHLLVEMTEAQLVVFRKWLPEAWKGCGGGFVDVKRWQGAAKGLFVYAMKEVLAAGKEYQHELPVVGQVTSIDSDTGEVGLEPVRASGLGRWWGVWGARGGWCERQLSAGEFFDLRRRVRRWGMPLGTLRSRGIVSWWAVAPPELVRGLGQ